MSIFGKLFKKKEDDFSFDSTDSFSPPPGSNNNATTPTSDPFGTPGTDFNATGQNNDPFGTPQGTPDPFASQSTQTNNSFSASPSQSNSPLPPIDNHTVPQSRGSQIAQDYFKRQETTAQPSAPQQKTGMTGQDVEMINLKLDAIKSQLEVLNHRLEKIEHEPKKRW